MSYGVRKSFYNSKAWKQVKNNIWIKQHLLCNRCHKPVYVDGLSDYLPKEKRRTGIVHHKIYLDNENVYDDAIALSDAMKRVASDAVFAEKLSKNASNIRKNQSVEKIIDKWMAIIND